MLSLIQRSLRNPRLWQLVLPGYWLALFIGTHIPIERLALSRGAADKFAHVAAFAVLAMLVAITWRLSAGRLRLRQLLGVWAVVVLYGAIEETTQPLVNRTASLIDWMADATGATLGLAIFWWALRPWIDHWVPVADLVKYDEQPTSWRRYSLRTLFAAMTIVAAICYWMTLPTMNAQGFVRAMHKREYAVAESLFLPESDKFPGILKKHNGFESTSTIRPLTWNDLWKGERRIFVTTSYRNTNGKTINGGFTILAYRDGLWLHPLALYLPIIS